MHIGRIKSNVVGVPSTDGGTDLNDPEMQTSALDPRQFSEILAINEQSSSGFLARITQKYIETSTSDIEQLEIMFLRNQTEEVRQLAHHLKSSSANLGAKHLAALCQVLESAASSQNLEGMDQQIGLIKLERDRVVEALFIECKKAA